jgi:hypothetical protein
MIHAPLGKTDFTLAERTPPFSRNYRESPGWRKSDLRSGWIANAILRLFQNGNM